MLRTPLCSALGIDYPIFSVGTRFLCSEEADASEEYKARVVQNTAEDTVYTSLFDVGWANAPHRVLRNKAVAEWGAAGRPPSGQRPGEGSIIGTVPRGGSTVELQRYSARSYPVRGFKGDIEYCVLYAGESCRLIRDVKPAAQIVAALVREAQAALEGLRR